MDDGRLRVDARALIKKFQEMPQADFAVSFWVVG